MQHDVQTTMVNLDFHKDIPEGFRFATKADVLQNLDEVKRLMPGQWDIPKLRDGWIKGAGYGWLIGDYHLDTGFGSKIIMKSVDMNAIFITKTVGDRIVSLIENGKKVFVGITFG